MNLEDFNFDLPKELIASRPLQDRDMSRLLVMEDGALKAALFKDLKCFLRPGDLLVINDTKVFKARLNCFKMSGAKVEIMTERILDKYRITAQTKSNSKLLEGDEILVNSTDIRAVLEKKDGYLSYFNFTSPIKEILEKAPELVNHLKKDSARRDRTPLHKASTREVAEILVSHGADINTEDRFNWTPLHTAKNGEVAEYLISKGANVHTEAQRKFPRCTPWTTREQLRH